MSWETLDTKGLQERRQQQHEITTSGNAGPHAQPLGRVLREPNPSRARSAPDAVDRETRRMMKELYGIDI